ncbi:DNA internalization-related competence protein ComEC/Rec2 [bacterium]|nr:DNA internalization-related competence protein ComEC/Rec2 [bacterium]
MTRRPALRAACALSAGILSSPLIRLPPGLWIAIWPGLFLLTLANRISTRFDRVSSVSSLGLIIWTGAILATAAGSWMPADHIARFACPADRVVLCGVLVRDPAARKGRFDLLVESDSLLDGRMNRSIQGRVLITRYGTEPPDLRYGDRIRVSGLLSRPATVRNPGGFDHRAWLNRSGIHALLKPEPGGGPVRICGGKGRFLYRKAVYPCRRFVLALIDATVPDPESRSLLRSLTLGDQGLISSDLREDFSRTGVVHILSVSGSHVGFMFVILSLVFGCLRIPEPFRSAAVSAGLVFYALLTEASAPVVRATVMAVTALSSSRLERTADPYNTLGLAAFGILLFRPLDLMDAGFQLSFLSVFSILAGYAGFKSFLSRRRTGKAAGMLKMGETVIAIAVVSVSAQVGTLAVSARLFNCVPLLSIPANAVAVPVSGAILAVSAATVAAAPVHAGLVSAYAALNRFLLAFFIRSIDWISSLPLSAASVPSPSIGGMLFVYGSVWLLFAFRNAPIRKCLISGLLLLLNLWVWPRSLRPGTPAVTWIQFDVGQGDAGLFLFPGGKTMLIDAGPASPSFDCGDRTLAPFLRRTGIRRLDILILTHPHLDHVGGAAALLEHFPVGRVLAPALEDSAKAYGRLAGICGRMDVPFGLIPEADSVVFSAGAKVFLFNPAPAGSDTVQTGSSANECSLITLIACGRTRWLSTGDAGFREEEKLMAAWPGSRLDALKIGHHGSAYSTSDAFLSRFKPELSVLSVGTVNRYGHPAPKTLDRISASGSELLRTDESGAIILESDGTGTRIVDWKLGMSGFRGLIRGVVSGPFVSRYGI